jgi:hypothetical protein
MVGTVGASGLVSTASLIASAIGDDLDDDYLDDDLGSPSSRTVRAVGSVMDRRQFHGQ